jgi:hypothetical protein
MTIRIAASILALFVACVAPVEAPARGAAFFGGRAAPLDSAPMSRAAIAPPRQVVAPATIIRPAIAPPRQVVALARIRAAPLTHFQHRRAPVVVWGSAPWFSGDDALWYNGNDSSSYSNPTAPWFSGYDNPTYVAPDQQNPPDINPITDRNAVPRRLGCRAQTYKVRSADDGGERAVNIVRC